MEFYDFPFSWEFQHPNWRTHIFSEGLFYHQPEYYYDYEIIQMII